MQWCLNYRWNVNVETDCCSEQVRIIFLALRSTICEIGNQAFKYQERDVTRNITEIVSWYLTSTIFFIDFVLVYTSVSLVLVMTYFITFLHHKLTKPRILGDHWLWSSLSVLLRNQYWSLLYKAEGRYIIFGPFVSSSTSYRLFSNCF